MKKLGAMVLLIGLSGCVSVNTLENKVIEKESQVITVKDAENARELATLAGDFTAEMCWGSVVSYLKERDRIAARRDEGELEEGPLSRYQRLRNLRKVKGTSGKVQASCAAMVQESKGAVRKLLAKVLGFVLP